MLGALGLETETGARRNADASPHDAVSGVRNLAPGEILFRTGDPLGELYRVERGSLCHYIRRHGAHHEIIEFVFPGGILGFGHIGTHITTAKAMLRTEISVVVPHEFECALRIDGQLALRVAAAADREFDYLRLRAMEAVPNKPTKRLAAFLVALSRLSAHEGRDGTIIPDEIASGVVAERLAISIDALASGLRQLETRGLVAPAADGLRISDIATLESLAEARSLAHPSHAKLEESNV